MSAHSPRVSVSVFQTSEMGATHVYFIKSMPPTFRSEPIKLQNLHKNSAAGFSQKNLQRELTDIMVWLSWL